tara:strand:+ start:17903 stop:18241 length:339 start_codon:yes stop_codon:yes gene_type:complete
MASRYETRYIAENTNPLYDEFFKDRGVRGVVQYRSPQLLHPTPEQIANLSIVGHIWTLGDRYWKLAFKHYGDAELWWVIAWFNQAPTEAHLDLGDVIEVPFPLDRVLGYLGV